MYEATLRRYNFDQSRMDLLFADGVYNCVSSSVLYAALATAAGILVTGNLTRDHAFCTVYIGGRKIDVETTNPNGFNPGTRKPVESHGGGTAYYVVPKKSYAGRKEVSLAMLVSAVGKNLMAGFDKKDDYERALPLALARFPYGLSPAEEQELRSDFDVVAGNYANLLNRADRCQEAVLFLEAVYARYGQTAYLGENYDVSAHNAVGTLVNSGRFQEAADFLSAHGAFISPETYRELDQALFLTAADSQVQQLAAADPDAALSLLRELRSDRRAGAAAAKKRLDELCEYSWLQKARLPFDAKDFLAAAALCDQALQEVPQSRILQTMRKQALQNHAVGYHNRFAQLANAGQYEEALAVLQQGLAENPGNATLQGDLKQLRRIMGR